MGIYLVSVDADDWTNDELLVAAQPELEKALISRGLDRYAGPPSGVPVPADEGDHFEEKLYRDMNSFEALCNEHLEGTALTDVLHWDMIIPVGFDGPIELPVASAYAETTTVCSAFRLLAAMQTLAAALELPQDVPRRSDNLDITDWFDEIEAGNVSTSDGPWRHSPDAAFYTAMYLRGAQFSIQRSCPMRYI